MLLAVEQRYGLADTKLTFDMLRSGHIPFNFFVRERDRERSPLRARTALDDLRNVLKSATQSALEPTAGTIRRSGGR
jgi:hypothetical protein